MAIFGRKCCESCAEQVLLLREIRNEVRKIRHHAERPVTTAVTADGRIDKDSAREIQRALRRLNRDTGGGMGMIA